MALPRKGSRASGSEYVYVHYGVTDQGKFEAVYETRDRTLSGRGTNHPVMSGRQSKSEIITVFRLSNIESVPITLVDGAMGIAARKRVQEAADKKKAEVEAKEAAAASVEPSDKG